MGTTVDLPLDFDYTTASSDRFHVTGTFESRNQRCPGINASTPQFVVEYLGNADDGPSNDDVLGFDAYTTFACASGAERAGDLLMFGRFSPDVAPSSTASGFENMNGKVVGAFSTLAPPAIFSQVRLGVTDFPVDDVLSIRETIVVHFGAGSAIGSYIAFGGQPAPGAAPPSLSAPLDRIHLIQSGDKTLYLQVGNKCWTFTPVRVSSAQAQQIVPQPAGRLDGEISASMLVDQPPTNELLLYRTSDSTLYLQQFDRTWTVTPVEVSDDLLASCSLVGALNGVVPPDVLMLEPTA